jgi:hypothetical protein
MIYSVYDLETGVFTGARVMTTTPELLPDAVPEGCGLVLGDWDHETHLVDLITGIVSVIAAPAPDWRIRKAELASAAYAAILQIESTQDRPVREALCALLAGIQPTLATAARVTAIDAQISAARTRYAAILATKSAAELDVMIV